MQRLSTSLPPHASESAIPQRGMQGCLAQPLARGTANANEPAQRSAILSDDGRSRDHLTALAENAGALAARWYGPAVRARRQDAHPLSTEGSHRMDRTLAELMKHMRCQHTAHAALLREASEALERTPRAYRNRDWRFLRSQINGLLKRDDNR